MTSLIQYGEDFDVIGSIIFGRLHFWRHWFNIAKILSKFGEQQLVVVNYACGLNQSETGKYFEWIIRAIIPCSSKMVSKRVIFGAFIFLVSSNFLYFEGVFNKTIIPFVLIGYEIDYSQLGPTGLVGYSPSHIQRVLME